MRIAWKERGRISTYKLRDGESVALTPKGYEVILSAYELGATNPLPPYILTRKRDWVNFRGGHGAQLNDVRVVSSAVENQLNQIDH